MRLDADRLAAQLESSPDDPVAWLRAQPSAVRSLPASPWARWILLALHRHRARQAFVQEVVRERLDGWFGFQRRIPQTGVVPGLEEWHYRFHGIGCCLTHVDGTELDVDFEHGEPLLDAWFYDRWLECAAALALVGHEEVLREAGTAEALLVLAWLRGQPAERAFEPVGTLVEMPGGPRRVYTIDELLDAELEPMTFEVATAFWALYEPLVQRWNAH
jgi:hypothetical protein